MTDFGSLPDRLSEAADFLAEEIPPGTQEIANLEGDVRLDALDLYCVNLMREAAEAMRHAKTSQARQREPEEALRDRERLGELIYLALYGPQGAVWAANDSKRVWFEAADRLAARLLNSPAGEQPECPDCPKYFGKCPTCHRPRPRPAAPSPTGGE